MPFVMAWSVTCTMISLELLHHGIGTCTSAVSAFHSCCAGRAHACEVISHHPCDLVPQPSVAWWTKSGLAVHLQMHRVMPWVQLMLLNIQCQTHMLEKVQPGGCSQIEKIWHPNTCHMSHQQHLHLAWSAGLHRLGAMMTSLGSALNIGAIPSDLDIAVMQLRSMSSMHTRLPC